MTEKNYIGIIIVLAIFIIFAGIIGSMLMHKPAGLKQVQWAAQVNITLCGEDKILPIQEDWILLSEFNNKAGVHVLENNVVLGQGIIPQEKNLTLGHLFDAINITFTDTGIYNYTNGDPCINETGTLKMTVNNQPRKDYQRYAPSTTKDPKKQKIKITFEP